MQIAGYCTIKKDAKTGVGSKPQTFFGKDVRVMEFDRWGGVLALNQEADALCMFDKEDVVRSFKCKEKCDVLMPANYNEFEATFYVGKVLSRKGGYNYICKNMVIAASLMKGEFTDDILFAKEREETIK